MIIALFALAVVMIVGGIASVIQGFPFVRLESGMAMTVAGATTASAGAVLLGIAAVAMRLRSLERAFAASRSMATPGANGMGTASEPLASFADAPVDLAPGRRRPGLGTAAGLGGAAAGGVAGFGALRSGTEPHFTDPAPTPATDPDEPTLPNLLVPEADAAPMPAHAAEPVVEAPEPAAPLSPSRDPEEEDLFAIPEHRPEAAAPEPARPETVAFEEAPAAPEPAPEPIHPEEVPSDPLSATPLRPSLVEEAEFVEIPPAAPEPIPEPAAEAPPAAEAEPKPEVVGTYASGGNTYVMFANGAIEAETPRGRYTFASLDELKAFVEAGGEMDARGAA